MIKACLLYGLVLLIGLFFQSSVIGGVLPTAVVPDVLVVLIVYISLKYRSVRGLFGVYCLGLLADLASGVYIGPNAAGSVVVFACSGILANRVYAERVFAIVFISMVCSVCKSLTVVGLILTYTDSMWEITPLIKTIVFEALATACVAPIVVKILQFGSVLGKFNTSTKQAHHATRSATGAWGSVGR